MNPVFSLKILSAIGAALCLTGCKVNVSGNGTLVDTLTGKTQSVVVSAYAKNTNKACAVSLTISDHQAKALYELKVNGLYTQEDASNFVDSSMDDCSKDSSVVVQARAVDRVIGHETVTKPVRCGYTEGGAQRGYNEGAQPMQHIKVEVDTVVTLVEGKILDKATGKVLHTFTATTEPREVAISSSNRGNCQ